MTHSLVDWIIDSARVHSVASNSVHETTLTFCAFATWKQQVRVSGEEVPPFLLAHGLGHEHQASRMPRMLHARLPEHGRADAKCFTMELMQYNKARGHFPLCQARDPHCSPTLCFCQGARWVDCPQSTCSDFHRARTVRRQHVVWLDRSSDASRATPAAAAGATVIPASGAASLDGAVKRWQQRSTTCFVVAPQGSAECAQSIQHFDCRMHGVCIVSAHGYVLVGGACALTTERTSQISWQCPQHCHASNAANDPLCMLYIHLSVGQKCKMDIAAYCGKISVSFGGAF